MRRYKVRYGASVAVRELSEHTTIGDLKHDSNLRAQLGYGDNVNAVFHGAILSDNAQAPEFIETPESLSDPYHGAIVMETCVNTKQ